MNFTSNALHTGLNGLVNTTSLAADENITTILPTTLNALVNITYSTGSFRYTTDIYPTVVDTLFNRTNATTKSLFEVTNKIQPTATSIVAAVFTGVLIILTLGGNFIVVASFCTFHDLRTICNFFIISLSVSDIMVALFAMPFWFVTQLHNGMWKLDSHLKNFWDCMDILCGTASIMNLTAVSFDRQLAITSPFSYTKTLTKKRAVLLICFVWLYAIGMASVRQLKGPNWPFPVYLHFVATFSFFLPLAVMLIMYVRIYLIARYQARRIGKNYANDIKAAKTIAVVIGVFTCCWLPFFIVVVLFANYGFSFPVPNDVFYVTKWLEYLNSCLNPIIYTCLNRTYRRAFRRLFLRCRKKIQRDTDFSTDSAWHNTEGRPSVSHITAYLTKHKPKSYLTNGNQMLTKVDEGGTDV
ncbi:probable G-protein coupled receptor No18 [Exaiptasia diaphana]|uniref:G-protein coupled receptors family 1 profile domain-containing protein n=1 Tax=Exaiptasia diaphana TaxID=2652724 RepID=A0A913Y4C4_EXADI|nr:probable G-protein coupled receptor No18 [Exaiptasia diaphana]XP_020914147.1 probable G-protein coupled receptor No18 [Exaiptasia diaphana]XP_020914225.1 probable G-protein coupled receptor No18 [Exaiptasia diaphana]XP_020914296.1 probable G-protein coupled receptor No18 [Exaiptasia diaphana]XP_020914365.1 probable G-protein coupled receptor No18 [Exaiptasia diaphana]XP_020914437.1 probable G-protein coupled receptor No18 [Exaiptasia diaphana]XP_020914509.1 probable G-protein coupled recep